MRAVVLGVLLLFACDKKSEPSTSAPPPPAARPAPGPAPAPAPAPAAAPAAPAPTVNCAALLTTEDVTQTCGAGYEVKPETNAIAVRYSTCALQVTTAGTDKQLASIGLLTKLDAAEASNWTKLQYAASTPIAGLGDRAWSQVKEYPDRHSTDYEVGVQKGRMVFSITATKNELNPRMPCTIEQFTELARKATPRIP